MKAVLVGVLAVLLLASACANDDTDSGSGTTTTVAADAPGDGGGGGGDTDGSDPFETPPGDPPQTVTQADVDAAIEEIPDIVDTVLEDTGVPGMAVAVVFEDDVVYAEGFGTKVAGEDDPVGPDTVFQIASVSKVVGATAIAGLIGEGLVDWDDPVVEHLPDFALSDPTVTEQVTIADLYSHRSGLPDHAGDLLEDLGYSRDDVLSRLALEPLDSFRNSYAYTNFGLTAAGVAAAEAAGSTWEDVTEEVLFDPAGMDNTSFRFADFEAAEDRATTHVRDEDGNWVHDEQRQPDAQAPAGGASSTANDMGIWLSILMNEGMLDGEQIIDPDALLEIHNPQSISGPGRTPSARASTYGLGLGVGVRDDGYVSWSHSGAFALGTSSAIEVVPGQRVGVAAIANGMPVGAPEAVAALIVDQIIDGGPTKDWLGLYGQQFAHMLEPQTPTDWSEEPSDPAPPEDADAYLGVYENAYYGPLEVVEDTDADSGLAIVLGPDGMQFPLAPYDGDTFLFTPPGENSAGPTGIVFTVEDGVATSVTAEFYDENGLGTWTRLG